MTTKTKKQYKHSAVELAILAAAKEHGVGAYQLCVDTGIDRKSIYRLFAGETRVSPESTDILLDYFGLKIVPGKQQAH